MKEKAIQEDVVCTSNVDVVRMQVRKCVKRPFIALVAGMKCPLRPNPAYRSEACQEEQKAHERPQ
jgi:hypothetical protein